MATSIQKGLFYNKGLGISTPVSRHTIHVKASRSCDEFDTIRKRLLHNKAGFLLVESIPDWNTGVFTFTMFNKF